jgi:hypothetical protein
MDRSDHEDIGLGTVLFGVSMFRHPRFGRLFGASGVVLGLGLLMSNLYAFPTPPANTGLIDLGPFIGLWYLAVSVQMWRSLGWAQAMRKTMKNIGVAFAAAAVFWAGSASGVATDAGRPRHLIYLHGRIVQEQQSARPRHPQFGYYELEKILDAFRDQGFVVSGEIRPKSASVSESADRVVTQVRRLLGSGVPADHVIVVGGSMGAAIALVASARLQNPDVRFCVLGACLSESVRGLLADEGKAPIGHVLSIREATP